MEDFINKQEILLVTNATMPYAFCNKIGQLKGIAKHADRLEEAVWNGMLEELLGDVVARSDTGKPLKLWQVRQGDAILEIELSDQPQALERHLSIDPYVFMYGIVWN